MSKFHKHFNKQTKKRENNFEDVSHFNKSKHKFLKSSQLIADSYEIHVKV